MPIEAGIERNSSNSAAAVDWQTGQESDMLTGKGPGLARSIQLLARIFREARNIRLEGADFVGANRD